MTESEVCALVIHVSKLYDESDYALEVPLCECIIGTCMCWYEGCC